MSTCFISFVASGVLHALATKTQTVEIGITQNGNFRSGRGLVQREEEFEQFNPSHPLDKCMACYNELTVLGEKDPKDYFDPGTWHRMFVNLMAKPIVGSQLPRHPTWQVTKGQFRLGLPNCDIEQFFTKSGLDVDQELIDIYQWNDVMQNSDVGGGVENFRVTRKELSAAQLERYHADECAVAIDQASQGSATDDGSGQDDGSSTNIDPQPSIVVPPDQPSIVVPPESEGTSIGTAEKPDKAGGKVFMIVMKGMSGTNALSFKLNEAKWEKPRADGNSAFAKVWKVSMEEMLKAHPAEAHDGVEGGWHHKFCTHVGTTVGKKACSKTNVITNQCEEWIDVHALSGCTDEGEGQECLIKKRADKVTEEIKGLFDASPYTNGEALINENYKSYAFTDKFAAVVLMAWKGDVEKPKCDECSCEKPEDISTCTTVGSCCAEVKCIGKLEKA